jgi:hypothetical protein
VPHHALFIDELDVDLARAIALGVARALSPATRSR